MADGAAIAFESTWLCAVCSAPFIPRDRLARYCSHACYERACYAARRARPDDVANVRSRCKRWYKQNAAYQVAVCRLRKRGLLTPERQAALKRALGGRGALTTREVDDLLTQIGLTFTRQKRAPIEVTRSPERPEVAERTVWQIDSPSIEHLPITAVRLYGALEPQWHSVYAYRVFSAITRAINVPHRPNVPTHCVIHERGSWWALLWPEALDALPPRFRFVTRHRSGFTDREWIRVGKERYRLRAPLPVEAGQYRVRLVLLTPLAVRASSRGPNKRIRTDDLVDLRGPLSAVSNRAGNYLHESLLHAQVLARDTHTIDTELGGHVTRSDEHGKGTALVGSLVIECNAPALWLLRCAERIGLGSDTSRGFGRVRLEDE